MITHKEYMIKTDVLVIGGGLAGLYAAIKAREKGADVLVVDKGHAGKTGATKFASLAYMVCNPEWGTDMDACMNTITRNGEYINDRRWTQILLEESLITYNELMSWGVSFPIEDEKGLPFVRDYEPFTMVRVGPTGAIGDVARTHAKQIGVKILDRIMITDLVVKDERAIGAVGFSIYTGDFFVFNAKATVLATGPTGLTRGDGDALAYRAGAELTSKEFPYTWPGAGTVKGGWNMVAARNVFMKFVNGEGKEIDITGKYELDLTMEFLIHQGKGPIFWNIEAATPKDIEKMLMRQKKAYPMVKWPFDPTRQNNMVCDGGENWMAVAAQTGGVWPTDYSGATSVYGLYAAGDCCGTRALGGYHCAPGFGLAGAAVTGRRAGLGALEFALNASLVGVDPIEKERLKEVCYQWMKRKSGFNPRWVKQVIVSFMTPYFVKYIKHGKRLEAVLTLIEFIKDHIVPKMWARDFHELWLCHEVRNIVVNAEAILRCGLFRNESRAMHYREDYPRRYDPDWLAWVKLKLENGRMILWKQPIPKEWWPDLNIPYEKRYQNRFPGELDR